MIHRQNYLDAKEFLCYITTVRQNSPETIARTRTHIRHLLRWADATPLTNAIGISPSFPAYLVNMHLSPSSIQKGLEAARHFFTFSRDRWPTRYRRIRGGWVEMLLPLRGARLDSRLPDRKYYTLADALKLVAVSAETLREERAKAGAAMLFLSAMRADALASLPIACVHLECHEIHQLPEQGVRTKNRKAAITYLLEIPELLEVVFAWQRRLQDLDPVCLWYSPLTSDGMSLAPSPVACNGRGDLLGRDLRLICERAQVPYLSPHKFRHGHAVYALKAARDLADLKAISQNMMHASAMITDEIYGRLVDDDVRQVIAGLGRARPTITADIDRLIDLLNDLKQPPASGLQR